MKFRVFIWLVCFSILQSHGQNQQRIDSLESILIEQSDSLKIATYGELLNLLVYSDIEKAEAVLKAELDLVNQLKLKPLTAQALMDEGNYHTIKANYEKAEQAYVKAKGVFLEIGDTLSAGKAANSMVRPLMYQGSYEAGLKASLESLRINEKYKAPKAQLIGNYLAIGNIQSTLERYVLSLEYYKKAEAIALEEDNAFRLAQVRHNIGENMRWLERFDEAIPYFEENINFFTETKNEFKLANTYNSMGNVYFEMGKIQESKPFFQKSYQLSEKLGNADGMAFNARNLGRISMSEDNPKRALAYYQEGLNNSIQSNSRAILVADYNNIASAFFALGDYKNAYVNKVKHHELQDSIYKKENVDKLNELEIQYQTEKKEAAIILQAEEIKNLKLKSKNDKLTKTLYGIGMVSFIAITGLLFFGLKQRIKKNKIALEKQEEIHRQEIAFKKKELASQTLHLVQKSSFIKELKENLENLRESPEKFKLEFRRIVMLLKNESSGDKDWEIFKAYFSDVHDNFDNKIKAVYKDITEKELRLASYIKMNLLTKEIAVMLNVLPDSVLKSKYRLKKKLQLDKETDLYQYLIDL